MKNFSLFLCFPKIIFVTQKGCITPFYLCIIRRKGIGRLLSAFVWYWNGMVCLWPLLWWVEQGSGWWVVHQLPGNRTWMWHILRSRWMWMVSGRMLCKFIWWTFWRILRWCVLNRERCHQWMVYQDEHRTRRAYRCRNAWIHQWIWLWWFGYLFLYQRIHVWIMVILWYVAEWRHITGINDSW